MNPRATIIRRTLCVLLLCGWYTSVSAQQEKATVQGPSQVNAGSPFSVTFTGPNEQGDYVTIVKKDAAKHTYLTFAYTKKGSPGTLTAPDEPGEYELRYILNQTKEILASQAIVVKDVDASVQGPAQVKAGVPIEVSFTGPDNKGDYVTIVPKGANKGKYLSYVYTKYGSPGSITAPDEPGDYELRYIMAQSKRVLASQPIVVEDVSASIQGPTQVAAGAPIEVSFTGPDNKGDYVTIVPKGASNRDYLKYAYTKYGSPGSITAPDDPGEYDLRYVTGQSRRVLASQPITVGDVGASVKAPAQVKAGASFEFTFTGPNHKGDFITVVPQDAGHRDYEKYVYTKEGSPASLPAPETPGDYEIRYLTGQSRRVLAKQLIKVGAVTASVSGPDQAKIGETIEVTWEGPNNKGDFITVVEVGSEDRDYGEYAYTKYGNPALVQARGEPGQYELRYMTPGRKTLARAPITLVGAPKPGSLIVMQGQASNTGTAPGSGAPASVEIILDASGSMLKKMDGQRRIDIAKAALTNLLNTLPAGTDFALRVFGHLEPKSCRTDLAIPLATLNRNQALQTVTGLTAKNLAKTPIGASLAKVSEDLGGVEGEAVVILLTDGEETCGGDPEQEIRALRSAGYDIRVNIVGFAIENQALKRVFQKWAQVGGGTYFDARNSSDLAESFNQALETTFQLADSSGKVVASGVVGGKKMDLAAGTYQLQIGNDQKRRQQIQIRAGETTKIQLD